MVKFYNSLQFRLTASFILLIILITALTYAYVYNEAKKALKETVREELIAVISLVSTQIKGDSLEKLLSLKPGDEGSPVHKELVTTFVNMREKSRDLANFYVLRKEGSKLFFIIDDAYFESPDDIAAIGEEYKGYEKAILNGFNTPTASSEFYTDQWGTFLSGYAPVKDRGGKTVALVGVDMKVEKVLAKQKFIGSLIYIIMGASIILAGLIILFFSRTIIKDINNLTKVSNNISQGELDIQLPVIKAKNEIYELNEALKSVIAAVEFLKEYAEEKQDMQNKQG